MKRYFGFIALLLITCSVNAQDILKGTVVETGTNEKLSNVFVHDTNNKQITLVDKDGKFEIRSLKGHLVIFDSPGYLSDTLFVADLKPLRVELRPAGTVLREVNINANKTPFNPRAEYPEVYAKSKVYVLSPSTWFSKEGKDARRLKRYFTNAERESYVDKYYTASYVASLIPLKGIELQNFMAIYRPSYAYVKNNYGPSLAVFINDSYQKYKALPSDKRTLPSLTGQ